MGLRLRQCRDVNLRALGSGCADDSDESQGFPLDGIELESVGKPTELRNA